MIYMLLIAFFIVVLDITGFKLDDDFSGIMYDIDDGIKEEKEKPKGNQKDNQPSEEPVKPTTKKKNPKTDLDKNEKEAVPQDADSMLEEIYGKGKK